MKGMNQHLQLQVKRLVTGTQLADRASSDDSFLHEVISARRCKEGQPRRGQILAIRRSLPR